MDRWKWDNYDEFRYISIPEWGSMGVITAFTAKTGGVSKDEFDSLNMALHVGDNTDNVIRNREIALSALSSDIGKMVCCEQIHGAEVAVINEKSRGRGVYDYTSALKGVDAMVTNVAEVFLTTFYADCYPLYFFDPKHRAIGIAHSGWKGTMGKISVKTIQTMQKEFKTKTEDLHVFIGPGIGKCCFEINDELAAAVKREFKNPDSILFTYNKGFFWDLENTNRQILLQCGINEKNIISSNLCTYCNSDIFYSYRRDKGKTGRMAAIIGLCY